MQSVSKFPGNHQKPFQISKTKSVFSLMNWISSRTNTLDKLKAVLNLYPFLVYLLVL